MSVVQSSPSWNNCASAWKERRGEIVQREVGCLHTHRDRSNCGAVKSKGEPLGSGLMESASRQYQVRF